LITAVETGVGQADEIADDSDCTLRVLKIVREVRPTFVEKGSLMAEFASCRNGAKEHDFPKANESVFAGPV
jgi:hypothetical protein